MHRKNGETGPPPASGLEGLHQFVVLAFGESPFLEKCLENILSQDVPAGEVLISTSTPSAFLADTSARYGVRLAVNANRRTIGADWNFAMDQATAPWVTLAHQDDIYLPDYAEAIRRAIAAHPDAVMVIPWFREFAGGGVRPWNLTHLVKYLHFLRAFGLKDALSSPQRKLRLLSLGNPVPCGGVALRRERAPRFDERLSFTLDWQAWLEAARGPGEFVFIRKAVMCRRIHSDSATTACTQSGSRRMEELEVFRRLWPHWAAGWIAALYRAAYRTNRVP